MNAASLVAALDLPPAARVDFRVPKKLLTENGAPTAADKRHLNEGLEECRWVATLKPATIAVPAHRDEVRQYLEINVLCLTMRPGAKAGRLVELVHRALPYPLVLVAEQAGVSLSLAHKRWSQNERGRTVLDGEISQVAWAEGSEGFHDGAFLEALALGRQPRVTLYGLYQGWMDTLLALEAARLTGAFVVPATPEDAVARRQALREGARLEAEIRRLRAAASKATQISRQVELNLELKAMEADLAAARARL